MMGIFTNPFFSVAGQVERIKNVGAVLAQSLNPFSKEKPIANVENKTLKAGLEFVAANPYTTAAIATGIATGAAGAAIAGASTKTKLILGAAALAGVPALVTSPTAAKTVIETTSHFTPESIIRGSAETGQEIEKIADTKSEYSFNDAIEFLKAHPYLTAATALAALVGAGYGAATAYSAIASYFQTKAAKKYLEQPVDTSTPIIAAPETPAPTGKVIPEKTMPTDEGSVTYPETKTISTGKKRYKRARQQEKQSIKQNVQVVVNNRATFRSILGVSRKIERYIKGAVYA